MTEPTGSLLSFLPLIIISLFFGVVANMLAKEKGRKVTLWTVLGFIPLVGYVCMPFFIGAANLKLEEKIDRLLERK